MSELKQEFQLLHILVSITGDKACLRPMIDFATQDAEQDISLQSKTVLQVETLKNSFRISQDNTITRIENTAWDLAYALLSLIHNTALQRIDDHIRIHAACADYEESRFIIIGNKGAGKTTLMLKLLLHQNGFRVVGDEMVLVKDSLATPFPRRFHVKTGFEILFKELVTFMAQSPKFEASPSKWLYGFSPAEAGYPWKIDTKPLKGIYFLIPNHGSDTRVVPCSGLEMVRNIMPHTYLSQSHEYLKIPRLCRLIDETKSFELHIGNLDSAVDIIRTQME